MHINDKIKYLFENSYIETNVNHNEAVEVLKRYTKQRKKQINILVNFDSHSDLYVNDKKKEAFIENWVNICIRELGITEFYWIIPNYISDNNLYKKNLEKKFEVVLNSPLFGFDNTVIDLSKINHQYLYLNKNSGEIITQGRVDTINNNCKIFDMEYFTNQIPNTTRISVFILTEKNLQILKNKEIFLSVDSDYFCNSGFDTLNKMNNINITKQQLTENFNNFIDNLYINQIKSSVVSLTYSPIYFPIKYKNELINFYSGIKKASHITIYDKINSGEKK